MMAATDELKISVRGTGGHGAFPHLAVDPVVAAAHVITALQTIASRNVEPVDAVVVSICSMATSQIGAFNVIPDAVQLVGTVRSFRPQTRDLAEKRVREIVTKVADAHRRDRRDRVHARLPATVNSAREAQFAARVGERLFGKGNVITDHEPDHGRRGLLVHAAGAPGRLRVPRPGRRPAQLLPAQSELRFQRRGDSRSAPATWRRWSRNALPIK